MGQTLKSKKRIFTMSDYKSEQSISLSEEDLRDAQRIENDPQKILALIDLIFMFEDRKKVIPS